MGQKINTAWMKRRYDTLRRRYFLDAQPGIHAEPPHRPPTAKRLTWVWAPEGSDIFGATLFDEDGVPYEIHLNVLLLTGPFSWERDRALVHEMTHMRLGPGRECRGPHGSLPPYWWDEQLRLARLGYRFL